MKPSIRRRAFMQGVAVGALSLPTLAFAGRALCRRKRDDRGHGGLCHKVRTTGVAARPPAAGRCPPW